MMKSGISLLLLFVFSCLGGQGNYDYTGTFPLSPGATVHLNTDDARVNIISENRKDLVLEIHRRVKEDRNKASFSFAFDQRDGDLYISEKYKRSGFFSWDGIRIEEYTIDIKMPIGVHLDLKGDDDDYSLNQLTGNIHIVAEDGDISLNHCSAGKIDIRLEDGDISASGLEGSLTVRNEDGDVFLDDFRLELLDLHSEDGDLQAENGSIGDCRISLEDGQLKLGHVSSSLLIETEDGDMWITQFSGDNGRLKSVNGDIRMSLHEQNRGEYNLTTEDGDISLELLGSGASISVRMEDGNSRITGDGIETVEDTDHRKTYRYGNGGAKIQIKTQDGDIYISQ